jgi:DtxR family Mn-dependent transcriptional regulator
MADTTELTPTLEDYLESICHLERRKGSAHVKDIAEAAGVHMSTVTTALRNLSEKGLVRYRPYKAATLTKAGQKIADKILNRHKTISKFLSSIIMVNKEIAEKNACRMEHYLDEEVVEHLALFAQFVRDCPRAGDEWLEKFSQYLGNEGAPPQDTEERERCLKEFNRKLGNNNNMEEMEEMDTLDKMKAGQKCKIERVAGTGAIRRRMVDMGAVKGTTVEVVKVAPLGDPIEVKIKGYNLTLRKEEAAKIMVTT